MSEKTVRILCLALALAENARPEEFYYSANALDQLAQEVINQ